MRKIVQSGNSYQILIAVSGCVLVAFFVFSDEIAFFQQCQDKDGFLRSPFFHQLTSYLEMTRTLTTEEHGVMVHIPLHEDMRLTSYDCMSPEKYSHCRRLGT